MSIPNLKQARDDRGWTQRELASRSGMSLAKVRRAEQGAAAPMADTVLAFALALNVSMDELMGRSVPENGKAPTDAERRHPVGA